MGHDLNTFEKFSARIPYQAMPDPSLADEMRRYVEHGLRPGGFLYALLSNDISAAMALSPSQSVEAWMNWLMDVPLVLHGSEFAVEQWIGWHADPSTYTPLPFTASLPFSAMASAKLAA